MRALDVEQFKDALGRYASGLVVVTAITSEGPAGFTCQTFGSLSLEPPLVLFAAASTGSSWSRVREEPVLGISVLSDTQESVARRFATSGVDKFEGHSYELGPAGAPLLAGALAHLEGHVLEIRPHGDHDVCVVELTYVHADDGGPLVYFRRGFGSLA